MDPKVNYRIHKSPLITLILSQIHPVYAHMQIFEYKL